MAIHPYIADITSEIRDIRHEPDTGEVVFNEQSLLGIPREDRRKVAKELQYVYQDPGASLDPRWKVGALLEEPLIIHSDHVGTLFAGDWSRGYRSQHSGHGTAVGYTARWDRVHRHTLHTFVAWLVTWTFGRRRARNLGGMADDFRSLAVMGHR